MRYISIIILSSLSVLYHNSCLASELQGENLESSYQRVAKIIEEGNYNEEERQFLHQIPILSIENNLRTNQIVKFAEFLRDSEQYDKAANCYYVAYKKRNLDRFTKAYLQSIEDEKGIDVLSLMSQPENDQKVIESLTRYWRESKEFLDDFLKEDSSSENCNQVKEYAYFEHQDITPSYDAIDIALYFLNKISLTENDLTNMKIQKLCSYSQGHYLALNNTPLFKDSIEAWTYGPVIPNVYDKFKNFKNSPVMPEPIDEMKYSLQTREFLDKIYEHYSQFSGWKLSQMTHEEPYWKATQKSQVISHDLMKDYFSKKNTFDNKTRI